MKLTVTDETIDNIIRILDGYARAVNKDSGLPCHGYRMEEMIALVKMVLLDMNK